MKFALIFRATSVALGLLGATFASGAADAPAYPQKPITIMVGFPPGGLTDVLARRLAKDLQTELKQTVIVENMAGASGQIATALVAKATAQESRARPPASGNQPLAGIRIIDLTMGWAGPLASRTLADLGAEVIKVESTGYPDWWRGANFTEAFYRERLYEKNTNFILLNRNKSSITLDLTLPEGRRILLQLIEKSDAVIENYSAEVLPKLGLDYPALRQVNSRLVMLSMPAFGLGNAWSDARAYGGTLEQASGLPLVTGHPAHPPAMTSYAYGDPIGGLNAGAALLLGLQVQRDTGRGRHINLSQVEAMLPLAAPFILAQSTTGQVAERTGNHHPLHAPHGCSRCAGDDAWIALSVIGDAQWYQLCRAPGRSDLAADPRLATAAIADWTQERSADAAMQALQAAGVAAGVVRPMAEVLQDAYLRARGFWQTLARAHVGTYEGTRTPYREHGAPLPVRRSAPTLGQHTHAVLSGLLGLSTAQQALLEAQGVMGTQARPRAPSRATPGTHAPAKATTS